MASLPIVNSSVHEDNARRRVSDSWLYEANIPASGQHDGTVHISASLETRTLVQGGKGGQHLKINIGKPQNSIKKRVDII